MLLDAVPTSQLFEWAETNRILCTEQVSVVIGMMNEVDTTSMCIVLASVFKHRETGNSSACQHTLGAGK